MPPTFVGDSGPLAGEILSNAARRRNLELGSARTSSACNDQDVRRLGYISAALLATLVAATGSAAGRARPSLTLERTEPVVVHGAHFVPGERVRITLTAGASVTVKANSHGAFTATLARPPADRCSSLRVRASGLRGSVALRLPLPQCLPARTS
jgi:hypothetical protein